MVDSVVLVHTNFCNMTLDTRYLLSALPGMLTLAAWQVTLWAYPYLHCKGNMKSLHACTLSESDITGMVGIGLFLCPLLSFVTVPASLGMMFSVWAKQYQESLPSDV